MYEIQIMPLLNFSTQIFENFKAKIKPFYNMIGNEKKFQAFLKLI